MSEASLMKTITAAFALLAWATVSHGQRPELEIASDHFQEVTDISVREGQVYVVDAMARAVLVFDEGGALVRIVGREGSGPLEFRRPGRLGWLGDTLWVRDTGNQRFTLIHGGSEVGTMPLSYPIEPPHEHLPPAGWGEWLLSDGGLLIAPLAPWNVLAQGQVASLPHVHRHRDGGTNRTLFGRDVRQEVFGFRPRGASLAEGMFAYHPFASGDVVTVSSDGSAVYVVNRSEYRVTRMTPEGQVLWSRRYPYERRPARPAIDQFVSFMVEFMGADAEKQGFSSPVAFRRAVEEGLAGPEYLPPVSAAHAASDGSLWVRREAPGSTIYHASAAKVPGMVGWEVISADGQILGRTRLPIRFEALHAEADAIWGVLRDELGVVTVVKYRMDR
jgi:hypothetical protein